MNSKWRKTGTFFSVSFNFFLAEGGCSTPPSVPRMMEWPAFLSPKQTSYPVSVATLNFSPMWICATPRVQLHPTQDTSQTHPTTNGPIGRTGGSKWPNLKYISNLQCKEWMHRNVGLEHFWEKMRPFWVVNSAKLTLWLDILGQVFFIIPTVNTNHWLNWFQACCPGTKEHHLRFYDFALNPHWSTIDSYASQQRSIYQTGKKGDCVKSSWIKPLATWFANFVKLSSVQMERANVKIVQKTAENRLTALN